jgi:hypothetical protein
VGLTYTLNCNLLIWLTLITLLRSLQLQPSLPGAGYLVVGLVDADADDLPDWSGDGVDKACEPVVSWARRLERESGF